MNENPYSSPKSKPERSSFFNVHRILWFGSVGLIGLAIILTLTLFGGAVADAINGWGNPVANVIAGLVSMIVFGVLCVPQYFSVFRRSPRGAVIVMRVCVVGIIIATATAIIYPVVEYRYSFSPPGAEILGAVFYTSIALLFVANRSLHKRWLKIIATDMDTADANER